MKVLDCCIRPKLSFVTKSMNVSKNEKESPIKMYKTEVPIHETFVSFSFSKRTSFKYLVMIIVVIGTDSLPSSYLSRCSTENDIDTYQESIEGLLDSRSSGKT